MSSPRKRRRAPESPTRNVKRDFRGLYNDRYRELLNEEISSAAARFKSVPSFADSKFLPPKEQIGASIWSLDEKSVFFAALEKLGRGDVSGIAKAIKSKSIPEVQELLLILHDAALAQKDSKLTARVCSAALEISDLCTERLELAGDALAWLQERFEANEEEERFGQYWLLTPKIADEVEAAVVSVTAVSSSSTPALVLDDEDQLSRTQPDDVSKPEILQHIPEGELLKTLTFLALSKRFFMNTSPTLNFPYPHWSTLASPFASEPSMYRTALKDFHTLAVSLTRRLVQTSLIQATSRIRAQDWRTKNAVTPLVKPRDVFTAIDILGLPRTRSKRWNSVARRCGIRVYDGEGKSRRELDWNEVEEALSLYQRFGDYGDSDAEASGYTSAEPGNEIKDQSFKARPVRSGTPLPVGRFIELSSDSRDLSGSGNEQHATTSEAEEETPGAIKMTLEEFDAEAGRAEELRLWSMLGTSPATSEKQSSEPNHELAETYDEESERLVTTADGWRDWIEYRATWETLRRPVPFAVLQANQRKQPYMSNFATETAETNANSLEGLGEDGNQRPYKRRKTKKLEIPIRGARAYAALQEKLTPLEDEQDVSDSEGDFPAPIPQTSQSTFENRQGFNDLTEATNAPVRSIEEEFYDPFEGEFAPFQSDYSMDS
ncbi:hypothetical protein BDV96DRAFT_483407 [Lophiotrema nucula]|uniref:Uncharacterized protein n=1 Tax=Lophiotrema nucula TaxID=690887 RepID=A0A6A5ZSR9_9PLEO|nr:hypothetical protein BDV96DRAFT_483407 [Lophiotrema nucula]